MKINELRPCIGVLLAGGLARRMGGGDKGLLQIGGRSILERTVDCLIPQLDGLVLNANGELLNEDQFRSNFAEDWPHISLYTLFIKLWERARREIQQASKISFVGVSFGPLFQIEMEHLFKGKKNEFEVIVANPSNKVDRPGDWHPFENRRLVAGKIMHFMDFMFPQHRFASLNIGRVATPKAGSPVIKFRAYNNFEDMISHEME